VFNSFVVKAFDDPSGDTLGRWGGIREREKKAKRETFDVLHHSNGENAVLQPMEDGENCVEVNASF